MGDFCAHLAEVTVTRRRGGAADTRQAWGVTALTGAFTGAFFVLFRLSMGCLTGEPIRTRRRNL